MTSFFLVVALVLYFRPVFNNLLHLRSFVVLLGLILVAPDFSYNLYIILIYTFFIISFYVVLALKGFVLVNRAWWHYCLVISLLYLATFITSFRVTPDNFFGPVLLLALSSFLGMSEFAGISLGVDIRKSFLIGSVLAFLIFQSFWVASLLPLGFIGVANFIFLEIFIFMELAVNFYTHKLDWQLVWRRIILFLFLAIALLGATKWRL